VCWKAYSFAEDEGDTRAKKCKRAAVKRTAQHGGDADDKQQQQPQTKTAAAGAHTHTHHERDGDDGVLARGGGAREQARVRLRQAHKRLEHADRRARRAAVLVPPLRLLLFFVWW
jgi:hypothetical protein